MKNTPEYALLSVSDKTGIADFAKGLHNLGVKILSTGGTAKVIKHAGVPVIEVSEFTGFPEILDGPPRRKDPRYPLRRNDVRSYRAPPFPTLRSCIYRADRGTS